MGPANSAGIVASSARAARSVISRSSVSRSNEPLSAANTRSNTALPSPPPLKTAAGSDNRSASCSSPSITSASPVRSGRVTSVPSAARA